MSQAELKDYMQELLKKYETAEKFVAKLSGEITMLKRECRRLQEENNRLRLRPKTYADPYSSSEDESSE